MGRGTATTADVQQRGIAPTDDLQWQDLSEIFTNVINGWLAGVKSATRQVARRAVSCWHRRLHLKLDMTKERQLHKPLDAALAKLQANRKASTEVAVAPAQMSLNLWPDSVRGVPNAFLRGALFGVSQRREVARKRELLASVDGIEIWYRGEKFNQTDLDVWQMLLHMGRLQPLGSRVEFTAQAFLTALGRGTSGKHREELKEEISRLMGGVVEIAWTKEKKSFAGSLVSNMYRDDESQRFVVMLDPKMMALYESGYSQIFWPHRRALKSNNLAKWLHGFYASHANPFPYKVETLRDLCGSKQADLAGFRRLVRAALKQLVDIDAIAKWEITKDDLVRVINIPTSSQVQHLNTKSNPNKK